MRSYTIDVFILAKDGSGDVVHDERIVMRAENLDGMRRQFIKDYSKYRTRINAYWFRRVKGRVTGDHIVINPDGTAEYLDHNLVWWNIDPRTGRLKSRIPAPRRRYE